MVLDGELFGDDGELDRDRDGDEDGDVEGLCGADGVAEAVFSGADRAGAADRDDPGPALLAVDEQAVSPSSSTPAVATTERVVTRRRG